MVVDYFLKVVQILQTGEIKNIKFFMVDLDASAIEQKSLLVVFNSC